MAAPVSRRVYSPASFIIRPNTMRHITLDENIDMTAIHNGTIILPNGSGWMFNFLYILKM